MVLRTRLLLFLPRLIFLSFLLIPLFISCDGDEQPPLFVQEDVNWYLCDSSGIVPTDAPQTGESRSFQPWTVQYRPAGFVHVGNTVFCGINGAGLLRFRLDEETVGDYTMHLNRFLFSGRTIGNLFAFKGSVYCHLYRNVLFSTTPPASEPLVLITASPEGPSLRAVVPPFQIANPEWEAVQLVPSFDEGLFAAWKTIEQEKTLFRYSRLSIDTLREVEISEEEFRSVYQFLSGDEVPKQLVRYGDEAFHSAENPRIEHRQQEGASHLPAVVHLSVKYKEYLRPERYRFGVIETLERKESGFISLKGMRVGSDYYILRDTLQCIHVVPKRGAVREIALPLLPENRVYTDFWTDGKRLIVSWEEQRFPDVGEAGLVSLQVPPK